MISSRSTCFAIRISLALVFAAHLHGQALSNEVASPALPPQAGVHQWVDGASIPPTKDAPFSAKVEIESAQSLPDGTSIVHKTINIIGRDISGKTRNEGRQLVNGTETSEPKLSFISLFDPETNTRTVLYPDEKVARVSQVKHATRTAVPRPSMQPMIKSENLGEQIIEGLSARGTKITTTYPAGAIGNDRPLEVVNEYWYSAELRMSLLVRRTDPRSGTQTVKLTDISQDPDPALFTVPADYKLVNESKP